MTASLLAPRRRPPLGRLTELEIRKSLSTRSARTLAGTAAVLPAVAMAAVFATGTDVPGARDMLGQLGTLVAMLMIAVGVLSTAGEWTHGTALTTFLAVPRRGRVLLAKYTGLALLGAAIHVLVVATSYAVAAGTAGDGFSWSGAGPAAVASIAGGVAMTVVGAGIGAALGNVPAALTGTYVLLLVVFNVLAGAAPRVAEWTSPQGAVSDLITGTGRTGAAVAVLAGWVLATTVAGAAVTTRRAIA